ncbi:MAG: DNA polymerase III subunit alpha [Gammaproteobacteria bacterium]|nr:DNA polymerase III subunit alpha [Gammaproteobacteria bacterium]
MTSRHEAAPTPGFVHLHVHTEYSLVDSVVRVHDLVTATAAAGMPAVAITDQGNLFGLVKFYRAALAAGVQPIVGAEVWYAGSADKGSADRQEPARLVLLCRNLAGYRNLSRLLTRTWLEGQQAGQPLLHPGWLNDETADGLIALSGGRDGVLGRSLLTGATERAERTAADFRRWFRGDFYVELQRTGRTQDDDYLHAAVQFAATGGLPVVATNDVRFLTPDEFDAHEARVCIQTGRVLGDPGRPRLYSEQQYLRSPAEMSALFADLPEALENSVEIARRCHLALSLGETHLPDYAVPDGSSPDSFLRTQSVAGLAARFPDAAPDAAYGERLTIELDVICRMGFAGYFLIVADFIGWAREHEIPVGPGRGSGAGSLVAWVLGITDLDPIHHDLLFERFLNPERVSMPDFDIDFCMEGRDRVIDYVSERYGRDRVSQIITYGTMAARAVVRDVGRVLGQPYGLVDRIAKLIPNEQGVEMTLEIAMAQEAELRELYNQDEDVRGVIDLGRRLEGLVRNAGRHAGGIVIAPRDITEFTPLYQVEGEKFTVTQFDKDDVEAAGLVKFDFLGLRTLTIIDRATRAINAARLATGEPPIEVPALQMDDQVTFRLLRSCKTTAVFQLESRGMRDLVRRLQPDSFDDLVALVALYRPGPLQSGMVDDFINRKHGGRDQPIDYLHPDLEPVLRSTYGVILYQEQVMQIAQRLAGYSLGEADLLRRAMGKKKAEEMAQQRSVFTERAAARGTERSRATYIFDLMEKFAGYGFNKSHSAAYAVLTYQTAWLKANHPAAFMAAVMTTEMGDTDALIVQQRECAVLGLKVLPPDVNASAYTFQVAGETEIRYGLGAIKGVGQGAAEHIVAMRNEDGPYRSLQDFCLRAGGQKLGRRPVEALIKAGAFDCFGPNRPSLLAALPAAMDGAEQVAAAASVGQDDMFGAVVVQSHGSESVRAIQDWGWGRKLEAERESLGLYLSGHPFDQYRTDQPFISTSSIEALIAERPPAPGGFRGAAREVVIAGLVSSIRKRGTRTSVELDDGTGTLEVGFFQEGYDRFRHLLGLHTLVAISGMLRFEEYLDGWRLNAKDVLDLDHIVESRATGLLLRWRADVDRSLSPQLLKSVMERHRPGKCSVSLYYSTDGTQARVALGDEWCVRPTRELRERLSELVGLEGFRFVYEGPRQ